MAAPVRTRVTEADRRHFDFVQTLHRISEALTKKETRLLKFYCIRHIPKGRAEKLKQPIDIFHKLTELDKIDEENLDFVEEILERMGRADLVRDILRPFQPPDRDIPENPELQPGTSTEGASANATTTSSDAFLVIHGQRHMIQETVDRHRQSLASLCGSGRSQIKFRGYKKGKSILVHYSIPQESRALLKHMADHSDPRLVYMGIKSLQINAEAPINVTHKALLFDVKRQYTVDDIEVGCRTRIDQQRTPKNWSRLSALNLFSDTLPLHLQVAESLEYQGFSYGLVQALVQKDQLREQEMKQLIKNLKRAEVDFNTVMTLRSKLTISEHRLKEALENIAALEKELQQAREYAEKAAKQVTSHVTEYRKEKLPGDWSLEYRGEKPPGGWSAQIDDAGDEKTTRGESDVGEKAKEESSEKDADKIAAIPGRLASRAETEAPGICIGDSEQGIISYGERGTEPGQFRYPRGVVVSSNHEIFVADRGNRRVQVHNTEGVYLRHFPTVVPGTEDMEPHDVSLDGNGTLWIVGDGQSADHVVQYSTGGIAMTQFDLKKKDYYRGIAVDMRNSHILVTDATLDEVQVFRPDGSLVRRFRHPEREMQIPRYITVDREGNCLVSDWVTHSIFMFDESGKFLLKFGGEGSGEGQLMNPRGICTDSLGHIIVADYGNRRIQMFTRHGEYIRTIDTGFVAAGVAVGPEGQLVVTNWDSYSVTVFPSYL
ncbi:PREDICTED: uncharacterized protein LOC109488153 [Branchiostoma belcheri]|uniref:Uncharacterized protein LOC109488153 n=1 Tax=Branchiostoma belcheri TaxID=7741 RepID=A0A6P5A3P3_BRABE|nr:PREDICTED: uncharacterized protein LOC109488153 [Branchiostoma belcheri]